LLAAAYSERGDAEPAIHHYEQAVRMDAANTDAWVNLGVLLCQQDRHDEAARAWQQAIRLNASLAGEYFREAPHQSAAIPPAGTARAPRSTSADNPPAPDGSLAQ